MVFGLAKSWLWVRFSLREIVRKSAIQHAIYGNLEDVWGTKCQDLWSWIDIFGYHFDFPFLNGIKREGDFKNVIVKPSFDLDIILSSKILKANCHNYQVDSIRDSSDFIFFQFYNIYIITYSGIYP